MKSFAQYGLEKAADMRNMVKTGEFIKLGKKSYEHEKSGIKIEYNNNRWTWEIVGKDEGYKNLSAAVSRIRYKTGKGEW